MNCVKDNTGQEIPPQNKRENKLKQFIVLFHFLDSIGMRIHHGF